MTQPLETPPVGWVMVPVEPTREMRIAIGNNSDHPPSAWRAAIAAAPRTEPWGGGDSGNCVDLPVANAAPRSSTDFAAGIHRAAEFHDDQAHICRLAAEAGYPTALRGPEQLRAANDHEHSAMALRGMADNYASGKLPLPNTKAAEETEDRVIGTPPATDTPGGLKPNPPEPCGGWRDIASAPKDGSAVRLKGTGYWGFEECTWRGFWNGREWQANLIVGHYQNGWTGRPTHWAPLPAPPEAADHSLTTNSEAKP